VRVVAAAASRFQSERQEDEAEESLSLRNDGRARSAREGDDEEESMRPVRVVLVENLIFREGHDEDQVSRREGEGDEEESTSRPADIVARVARNGDDGAAVGVARMAAREADEIETYAHGLLAREADEEEIFARVRARLRRGEMDAHAARTLARLERSYARFQRESRRRRLVLGPPLEVLRGAQRGGGYNEALLELRERRAYLELRERRAERSLLLGERNFLAFEERRLRLIELEERIMNQERAMDRLTDGLIEDWLDEGEDIYFGLSRRRWPPREDRDRPVQPPEPPRPPTHIQEYENFNRSAGMTFTKAAEGVELATASPEFDPSGLFLKRVTACIGWAVHGLVFEFVNGKRMGAILVDFGDRSLNLSDESIEKRAGVGWTDIDYGDFIVGMHGDRLADPGKMWFCHTLVLQFHSGKSIRYEAKHEPWRGLPFSYTVPQPCLVYRIAFKYEQGEDMLGLKSSFHLPINQGNMVYLPPKYKTCVKEILMIGRKIDSDRESKGEKPLGNDVWWRILSMLRGWQLLPHHPIKEEEEEKEASSESSPEEEQNRGRGERWSFSQMLARRGREPSRGRFNPFRM
jgi:hypothetical protein